MEDKKVLEVVRVYKQYFKSAGVSKLKYPNSRYIRFSNSDDVLSHCHSMLSGIEEFISACNQEKRDRALVRLGFVQGCLWTEGVYTVEELKNHNLPDERTVNEHTHEPLTKEELEDWEY